MFLICDIIKIMRKKLLKLSILFYLSFLILSVTKAEAFNQRKLALSETLKTEKACVSCELSNTDLSGLNLVHADLRMAVLYNVKMERVNLKGANLKGAILYGSNLRSANLSEANLTGTDLRQANLANANLKGANLTGVILYKTNLTDTDLTGAILKYAVLDGTIFCRTIRPSGQEDNTGCR